MAEASLKMADMVACQSRGTGDSSQAFRVSPPLSKSGVRPLRENNGGTTLCALGRAP
jgi:hypothetical protein